jgi:hypothetical protein
MGIEDLGGLGNFAGFGDNAGFNMDNLHEQMVEMCKSTLADLRKNQQAQQKKLGERQQQLLNRRKKTDNLSAEQVQQWSELEAAILANPEFIEPLGITLAGLIRSKADTATIIDEFPDLRFEMVSFLRQRAAEKRDEQANATRTSPAPAASAPPVEPAGAAATVTLDDL